MAKQMWLRRFQVKYWSESLQILTCVATSLMTLFTYFAVKETKNLIKIEIGPNISLADIVVETVDNSNTVLKRFSWLDGELMNQDAVRVSGVKSISITSKFSNNGRNSGYIQLMEVKGDFEYSGGNNLKYLVPAQGSTGQMLGIDMLEAFRPSLKNLSPMELRFSMVFQVFDPEMLPIKKLNVDIRCSLTFTDPDKASRIICEPSG